MPELNLFDGPCNLSESGELWLIGFVMNGKM